MNAFERLLQYATFSTQSDDESDSCPSTAGQIRFGAALAEELKKIGCSRVRQDADGYVYAEIPATASCSGVPAIGFIAHMDTAPDFCGEKVHPQVIPSYDGGEIPLGTSGTVLSPNAYPHLTSLRGHTLAVTDGTTLLGADDKAGIAEIVTMAERLLASDEPHGRVAIAFTPDEEIGRGADRFDLEAFGAQYAYTMDGSTVDEYSYETFNAAQAHLVFRGVCVHPGDAKGIMVNAAALAAEFHTALPAQECPRCTAGREGFFHLTHMSGTCERAELTYLIRDHDEDAFRARKQKLADLCESVNREWGAGTVVLTVTDQYRNMASCFIDCPQVLAYAEQAIAACGGTPQAVPTRGGTDGARLSYMGLPCPNLGTGAYAYHGPCEHASAQEMERAVRVMLYLVSLFAKEHPDHTAPGGCA